MPTLCKKNDKIPSDAAHPNEGPPFNKNPLALIVFAEKAFELMKTENPKNHQKYRCFHLDLTFLGDFSLTLW